jgi:hypothetical protein
MIIEAKAARDLYRRRREDAAEGRSSRIVDSIAGSQEAAIG